MDRNGQPAANASLVHSPQLGRHSSQLSADRAGKTEPTESPQGSWSGDESGAEGYQDDSRKRRRPMSVSCELCKQRKVKCDRGQPSCGWCSRNHQRCEYKERKKPGLRAGYGRELEQRLDRLEEVLQRHDRILDGQWANNGAQNSQSAPKLESPAFSSPPIHSAHVPRAEAALFLQKPSAFSGSQTHSSGLSDYKGSIEPPPTTLPTSNGFHQPTAADSLRRQALPGGFQTPQTFYSHGNPGLESPSMTSQNGPPPFRSQSQGLPPYDILWALADLYFKHINTWCPILHRKSSLETLFNNTLEADEILLHAIVATTLRFSTDPQLDEASRKRYHDHSKQRVLLYGMENSSVKALQALVILALDFIGTSNGPPGWNLLALITRSAVQLGLAVETTSSLVSPDVASIYTLRAMVLPDPRSWIEDESRRRLFWMIYLLDRYTTISTAFEFALDEKEIDRKLPCREDLFARNQSLETRWFRTAKRTDYSLNKPENLGAFAYYIEILGILSSIHQFLKKPVDICAHSDVGRWKSEYRKLDSVLENWKNGLPCEYSDVSRLNPSSTTKVNCGWVMLHATYHTTVIRLHSSAAYPTTVSSIFRPSVSASQRCRNAVRALGSLGQYVVDDRMLKNLGPPFAFTLWVAARVLLVHGSTIEQQVSPEIHFFVDTLREMGKYWAVAERYTTILQRVLDEYRDSQRAANADGTHETPDSVQILADMRRCAYDLDFLISRQPEYRSSNLAPALPAHMPAQNEYEQLECFGFFNQPNASVPLDGSANQHINGNAGVDNLQMPIVTTGNYFTANFPYDANTDWL
ncbi:MAG: hypothetical protein M1819_002348 [Sarea resinae]|nr:MAG: hypothetical protein M1819_002348 [Sarea resinae]